MPPLGVLWSHHPTPLQSGAPTRCQDPGQPLAARRGSRQAVVGIQALRLHVVNCGERGEGLPGWEPRPWGGGVSPGSSTPPMLTPSPVLPRGHPHWIL